jgi:hypothetical protein
LAAHCSAVSGGGGGNGDGGGGDGDGGDGDRGGGDGDRGGGDGGDADGNGDGDPQQPWPRPLACSGIHRVVAGCVAGEAEA